MKFNFQRGLLSRISTSRQFLTSASHDRNHVFLRQVDEFFIIYFFVGDNLQFTNSFYSCQEKSLHSKKKKKHIYKCGQVYKNSNSLSSQKVLMSLFRLNIILIFFIRKSQVYDEWEFRKKILLSLYNYSSPQILHQQKNIKN